MKKNDLQQLHEMALGELTTKLSDLKRDLTKSRLELKAAKLEDIKKPSRLKVDIARVKTIIRAKQLAAAQNQGQQKEDK